MRQASIFLAEDEALIRMMLAEMVDELGHRVVAEAGNIQDAQVLAETAIFDLAILDINIAGSSIVPVAEIIDRRGLPPSLLYRSISPRVSPTGNYIATLPKAEHEAAEWQAAMEALILVATHGGPTMFARIGVMRVLNRRAAQGDPADRVKEKPALLSVTPGLRLPLSCAPGLR